MKYLYTFLLLVIPFTAFSQSNIKEFTPKIEFDSPDSREWNMVMDQAPTSQSKGVYLLKHTPISDSLGRPIEPIMAITYGPRPDSVDVLEYSITLLGGKPFKLELNLLGGYPDYSNDVNSIVYKASYVSQEVEHKTILGYLLGENIAIEIITDATTEIYPLVEKDFFSFIKSVRVNKTPSNNR